MEEKMINSLDKLLEKAVGEIDKLTAKSDMSLAEWDGAEKVLKVMEKACHIKRGEDPDQGSSFRNYYIRDWDTPDYGHHSYDNNSYARGRNMYNGRYMSRDNDPSSNGTASYGGSGNRDYMMRDLETAMNSASSEHDRMMIRDLMSRLGGK